VRRWLLGLGLLLLAGLGARALVRGPTVPPEAHAKQDGAEAPAAPPAPDDGWTQVAAAGAALGEPDWDTVRKAVRRVGPLTDEERALARPYGAALDAFEAGMAAGRVTVPAAADLLTDPRDFDPFRDLAWLALVRAWDRAPDDPAGPVGHMVAVARAGARLRALAGDEWPLALGQAVQARALIELGELLDSLAAGDRAAHVAAVRGLGTVLGLHADIALVAVHECRLHERMLGAVEADPIGHLYGERVYSGAAPLADRVQIALGMALLYDPADARKRLWERCRSRLAEAERPAAERTRTPPEPQFHRDDPSLVEYLDDPMARVFVDFMGDDIVPRATRDDQVQAATAVLLVAAASRGWSLDHAGTPPHPERGIPGWLDSLPHDPFGGTVKIDAHRAWSAGESPDLPDWFGPLSVPVDPAPALTGSAAAD
jgi:hypothetical protein